MRLAPRGTLKRGIAHPERTGATRRRSIRQERKRAYALLGDSTLVAWYHSLTHLATGGAYDSHHRTAGIAGCTRRRGGCVAARGAGTAAGDAGDRVPRFSSA